MSTSTASHPSFASGHKNKRRLFLIALPALALLVGGGLYLHGGRYVETENAYIKADKVPVSVNVSGTVTAVMVQDNQSVQSGQPLLELDRVPLQMALQRAQARLAQVRTDLLTQQAAYREKQSEIRQASTREKFAQREAQRQADLVSKQFVSASRYDEARQAADLASQQVKTLEQDLQRLAVSLGGSIQAPVTEHPSYLAAQAELAQAQWALDKAQIVAPQAGVVSNTPKVGQFVPAGGTALMLVGNAQPWVEANFTETELTHVRVGQHVTVHVDTYPDQAWEGQVESLSPATGSEFSLIPAQNATGNWVKVAQRIPLRVRLQSQANAPQLRTGMSAIVEIDTGHKRRFLGLSL